MLMRHVAAACVVALGVSAVAASASGFRIPDSQLEPVTFADLDGWTDDDQAAAFAAFRKSCDALRARRTGGAVLAPLERSLAKACARAMHQPGSAEARGARRFFEHHFRPWRIARLGEQEGFLTGYYEPVIEGSRSPGDGFYAPIYRTPPELRARIGKPGAKALAPYHDRSAIEHGALAGRGLEICWVRDEAEAFFIHIQGSARIRLTDGSLLRINYDAQNGHAYFPVGRSLIERGIVPREDMTMDKIRTFIAEHDEEGRELMRMNPSYIFFREVTELAPDAEPIGAQGVSLTADRSVAVDRKLHVYGTPFWIEADLPLGHPNAETRFRRLMLAQDTGGAIVGPARADIYFGPGVDAGTVAGRIRHFGRFYMLLPRDIAVFHAAAVPLPPKRPKP